MFINPINITQNNQIRKFQYSQGTESVENPETNSLELSDYQVGKAVLANRGVSFKNLSMPIEVTDKYNKKFEGKDHLDLSNIHVYEYPDTNLRVMVDENELVKTTKINFSLNNTKPTSTNPMLDNLLYQVIKSKINDFDSEIIITGGDGSINYTSSSVENDKINKILFDTNYTEQDLKKAKFDLLKYFDSNEYNERNLNLSFLYPKETLYDKKTFMKKVNEVSLTDLKTYHENFINNSCAEAYVITPKSNFDNNKVKILKNLNSSINTKLKSNDAYEDLDLKLSNNNKIHLAYSKNVNADYELNYNYFTKDTKESIISQMVLDIILTSELSQNNNYHSSNNNYNNNPVNLKRNNDLMYDTSRYKFEFYNKKKTPDYLFNEFERNLLNVCNSDISKNIEILKQIYKTDIAYNNENEIDSLSRMLFLMKSGEDIFNIYEIIDSINQDDVKKHIKKYLIDQKPIILLKTND